MEDFIFYSSLLVISASICISYIKRKPKIYRVKLDDIKIYSEAENYDFEADNGVLLTDNNDKKGDDVLIFYGSMTNTSKALANKLYLLLSEKTDLVTKLYSMQVFI